MKSKTDYCLVRLAVKKTHIKAVFSRPVSTGVVDLLVLKQAMFHHHFVALNSMLLQGTCPNNKSTLSRFWK